MEIKTSIIDAPKKAEKDGQNKDQIGIDKYKDALVSFIDKTDTPITIAVQGEWGSGKTSLMNSLKDDLCDQEGKRLYPIWINTWQYSLMKESDQALISIIRGITDEILTIVSKDDTKMQDTVKKVRNVLGNVLKAGTKMALNVATGQDTSEIVDAGFGKDSKEETVLELRNVLNQAILDCIDQDEKKDGFVFFIDDLDRIDPPVAVQILELIKNIFDLDKCVFILAIDYDVVVKGLEPKFGKLTDKNEREFRSFFDKIIQLPFSMPIASYEISKFLKDSLQSIGYLNEVEAGNEDILDKLSIFTNHSLGNNPRSLKRLFNTLSLIEIINKRALEGNKNNENNEHDKNDKLVNFALVCAQISYPAIYKALCDEPDFINWDENIANKFKLRKLEVLEIKNLADAEEFNEAWEQVLFRLCEKDSYLSKRVFNISSLLNSIKEEVPDGEDVGNYVSAILELSSVTDVQAFGGPKKLGNRAEAQLGFREFISKNITSKLIEPFKGFKMSTGDLNRSQRLWFDDEKGKHFLEVRFLLNVGTNLIFSVNLPTRHVASKKVNPNEDTRYVSLMESYDKKLNDLYLKFGYKEKHDLKSSIKLNQNKTAYVMSCRTEKRYQNGIEFYKEEELMHTTEFLVTFGHCIYNLFQELKSL